MFDTTQPAIANHAKRYLSRTYGQTEGQRKWDEQEFSPIDVKMILTMNKLQSSYSAIRGERKHTVMTSRYDIEKRDVIQRDLLKKEMIQKETAKKERLMSKKTTRDQARESTMGVTEMICKAYKMSGDKCTAKSKNGTGFCARHSKK